MKLHGYWRSSAAYRVRIALNLKGLQVEHCPVHLVNNGGEQHSAGYQLLNPSELVPTLEEGELSLNQSLAIIQYLEDSYPQAPLYPEDPAQKAAGDGFCIGYRLRYSSFEQLTGVAVPDRAFGFV